MVRQAEVSLLVLDVGPTMTAHIPHMRRAVHTFLHNKLVYKLDDLTAIVLSGTAGSDNVLFHGFGDNQYANITTVAGLAPPTIDTARRLDAALAAAMAPGGAAPRGADWPNALIVGCDRVWEVITPEYDLRKNVRIVLVSNFASPSLGDPTAELIPALIARFTDASVNITLEIVNVDLPLPDPLLVTVRNDNLELVAQLCAGVPHTERVVTAAGDLAGIFRAVDLPLVRSLANLHLEIGDTLKIPVKLAKKTARAKPFSLGFLSPVEHAGGVTTGLNRSTEWYRKSEVERDDNNRVPVDDENRIMGYRYGVESVPFGLESTVAAIYDPEKKGMRVLGFVPQADIPREQFMGEPVVAVADKDNPAAGPALAALVIAMAEMGKAAVVRLVRAEKKGKVEVCVALPVVAADGAPDHLLVIRLPFWEDVRPVSFPALDREGRVPNEEQRAAALALVDGMFMGGGNSGIPEDLVPELTAAPILHRFSTFFMLRAMESDEGGSGSEAAMQAAAAAAAFPDPLKFENDVLLQRFLGGARENPGAPEAAAGFGAACPTGHTAREYRAAVHRLRPGHAIEDFNEMVDQENMTGAINAARREIERLVDESVGDAGHVDAARLLRLLRNTCIKFRHAAAYNQTMFQFEKNIGEIMHKQRFWKLVVEEGLAPISAEEAAQRAGEEGVGSFGHLIAAEKVEEWVEVQKQRFEGGEAATQAAAAATQALGEMAV